MSPPRKGTNEGFRKGAIGIDGRAGEDFSRKHAVNPWDSNPQSNWYSGTGGAAYTNNEPGLRDTGTDPENYAKIDILDMVEGQAAKTGPVVLRKRDR